MMPILMAVIAIVVVIGLIVMGMYNGLVRSRQMVAEAWSGIDVQLKRRLDLIPNLVNSVKGYAKHEKDLLEDVTKQRAAAINAPAGPTAERARAEGALSASLRSIFAVAENYPQLKASDNFVELQRQLAETEDQISAARRVYNGNVQDLNTKIESFPSSVIAGMYGFQRAQFFAMSGEEKAQAEKAPDVKF